MTSLNEFKALIKEGEDDGRGFHAPPSHLVKGLSSPDAFLFWAKGDVNKAYSRWRCYWATRFEIFGGEADITSPAFAASVEKELTCGPIQLPYGAKDKDGRQAIIVRMRLMDYNVLTPETVQTYFWFILHKAYEDSSEIMEKGVIAINDMADLDRSKNIRIATVKYLGSSIQDVLPVRIGGIYIVRQPWFFSAVFQVLSPFFPTKLRQRIKFLGDDVQALTDTFPPSSIPTELGGTLEHDHGAWVKTLLPK